jgi:hypothetical protein
MRTSDRTPVCEQREAIETIGWIVLSHPPYSRDLVPSDFHLSGLLKDALRGRHFPDDDEPNTTHVKSSGASAKSFTRPAYSVSRKGGKSMLIIKKTLWKNNLNFVKKFTNDIWKFYYNRNCSFWEKIGGKTFVLPLEYNTPDVLEFCSTTAFR